MKKQTKLFVILVSLLTVFSTVPTTSVMAAGRIGFYFTPASQTIVNGSSFSAKLMVDVANRTSNWVTLKGTATYPKDLLQVSSIDTTASNYPTFASTSFNNTTGTISFDRTNTSATINSTYVFTVNFKAIKTGAATLAFGSLKGQNSDPIYANGGTYTIVPPSCPAGQIGTPPNCSTPTPKPTPTPTPTPKPTPTPETSAPGIAPSEITPTQTDAGELSIRDTTTEINWQKNTLVWSTTLPDVTSVLELGTAKDKLTTKPEVIKNDDGSYTATITKLTPGTRYYYRISATLLSDTTKQATYSGAFTTKGYPITLLILDEGRPAVDTKVTINNSTYTTDKKGVIKLELAPKKYTALVARSSPAKQFDFTVSNQTTPPNTLTPDDQKFTFELTSVNNAAINPLSKISAGAIIATAAGGVLLLGAAGGFMIYRRRQLEYLAAPVPASNSYDLQQFAPPTPPEVDTQATNYPSQSLYSEQLDYSNTTPVPSPQVPVAPEPIPIQALPSEQSIDTMPTIPNTAPSPPTGHTSLDRPHTALPQQDIGQGTPLVQQHSADLPPAIQSQDDPSAIFHPQTGELKIIHRSTRSNFQKEAS